MGRVASSGKMDSRANPANRQRPFSAKVRDAGANQRIAPIQHPHHHTRGSTKYAPHKTVEIDHYGKDRGP